MKSKTEYAQLYQSLGWSLIPIRKDGSKKPVKEWAKFQSRHATDAELNDWFGKNDYNIGLVCGEISGVAVIDSDSYKEQGGQIKLASTLVCETPRGGQHFYYQCPKDLRPSVNEEIAVDIRGNGSYVLLPPSVINGKRYRWVDIKSKETFTNLPALPLAYLEKIKPENKKGTVDFSKLVGTLEGARDDRLYKALIALLNRIPDAERETQGLVLARGINTTFKPPLPDEQALEKLKQAIKFVREHPFAPVEVGVPSLDTEALIKSILHPPSFLSFGFAELDKILEGVKPEFTYLVAAKSANCKSAMVLNILYKLTKKGTSCAFFDLENGSKLGDRRLLQIHTAWSKPILDDFKIGKLDQKQLRKVVEDLRLLPLYVYYAGNKLFSAGIRVDNIIAAIRKVVAENQVRVVVVDNLRNIQVEGQDENRFLSKVLTDFDQLANELKISVFLVHHVTIKGDEKGIDINSEEKKARKLIIPPISKVLGTSDLVNKVKVALTMVLDRDNKKIHLWVQKNRDGEADRRFSLNICLENLCISDPPDYREPIFSGFSEEDGPLFQEDPFIEELENDKKERHAGEDDYDLTEEILKLDKPL